MKRKVCIVSGGRADYGLLRWVMESVRDNEGLELQVVATGMHLAPEFGLTYREIERDGLPIDAKVEMLLSSDTASGIAKSLAVGIIGFTDTYERLQPDVIVVLGDRFEILAAAQAAFFAGICIAHVSGGEVTEGALDDSIRHCITKMAHYHFVAAEAYRRRVIQLGEQPDCVFNVGDPGLDSIARLTLPSLDELGNSIGLSVAKPFFLATYHPVTADGSSPATGMQAMLDALDEFPDYSVILTKSNADSGGRQLNAIVDTYALARPGRVLATTSLGQTRYLAAMKHCAVVVGNSSSGIVEAPALGVPTVDVGKRQRGRLKADSIIGCTDERASIAAAIAHAITPEFRKVAANAVSLYGNCDASTQIVNKLMTLDVARHCAKHFHDLAA